MSSTKLNKLINIWYYITVFLLMVLGVKFALPILLPFILAIIVASILKKPINYIENKLKIERNFVSFIFVTLVLLLILTTLGFLFYSIYDWLRDLLDYLPQLLPTLTKFTDKVTDSFVVLGQAMPESFQQSIKQLPSNIIVSATGWLTSALSDLAKGLPNGFITIFITILSAYIITRDYNKLSTFFKSAFSTKIYNTATNTKRIILSKVIGIIKGYSIITLLTFLQLYVGFTLLKVRHASAIALVVSLVDLLPVLGVGAILIPWAFFYLISGSITQCVGLLILYSVITIIHNILTPKIVANQIKIDALTVLASMYIGYSIVGFFGLVFAPLIAAVIRDLIMNEKAESN